MNILFTTFRYFSLTGTETFSYTVLKQLSQAGHKVFFYSPFIGGKILQKTKRLNVFITDNIDNYNNEKIDVIHAQHNLTAIIARAKYPQIPMIYMMHGVQDFLEQPPDVLKCNFYGGISKEIIGKYLNLKIPKKKAFIFPNVIDTDRFSPINKLPQFPQRVIVLSNYIEKKGVKIIKKVARKMNLKVKFIGRNKQIFSTPECIRKADIVISLGRGALEGMSCGKAVIVFTYHKKLYQTGDGMVEAGNIKKISLNNFSGRSQKIPFNEQNITREIEKYRPEMGSFNRQYVLDNFDVKKKLSVLTKTYSKAKASKALSYNKKQVAFIAQAIQRLIDYEKLVYRYRPLSKLLLRRFKDQLNAKYG
jgi:glycosyltransferase involved in cell wall biosynthesis